MASQATEAMRAMSSRWSTLRRHSTSSVVMARAIRTPIRHSDKRKRQPGHAGRLAQFGFAAVEPEHNPAHQPGQDESGNHGEGHGQERHCGGKELLHHLKSYPASVRR